MLVSFEYFYQGEKTLNENRHDTGKADESAAGIYYSGVHR